MALLRRTPKVRIKSRDDWQTRLRREGLRLLWGLRLELVLLAAVATVWLLADVLLPRIAASLAVIALLIMLLGWPRSRGWLLGKLWAAQVRRRWERACRSAKLVTLADRVPAVVSVRRVLAGESLRVRMPAGLAVTHAEAAAETIAACLAVAEVRVARDRANARYAAVTLVRRDPLDGEEQLRWPLLEDTEPEVGVERERVA